MTSQLVQAYIDKENATSLPATNSKGRLGSLTDRQAVKTFGVGPSSLVTPRRALGNLSNDATRLAGNLANSHKKQQLVKGEGKSMFKKPGLSLRNTNAVTPSSQKMPKQKVKPRLLVTTPSNTIKSADSYPDIETMHIYQDKEAVFEPVPPEDCLSMYVDRLTSLRVPPMPWAQKGQSEQHTDFSSMQLETNGRWSDSCIQETLDSSDGADISPSLALCLDITPLESTDFMDINNFKIWEDE